MKAGDIADFLSCEIIGDPDKVIRGPGYLYTAKPDELVYCFLKDDEKDLGAIRETRAGAVICQKHLKERITQVKVRSTVLLSDSPKYDFASVLQRFFIESKRTVSPYSHIGKSVKVGTNVDIHPAVVIHDGTIIGNGVTVRAGAVLGAEGLDYGKDKRGKLKRVPHLSSLIIEDDVDIGSNTTIQKGMLRPTIIGEGTKIGPNCDIGHETKIGRNCIITGMTLVAGATEIGDNTYIAPHSTVKNSIRIGKNVFVGIGSLVLDNVPDNISVIGRPAVEITEFRRKRKRLKKILGED